MQFARMSRCKDAVGVSTIVGSFAPDGSPLAEVMGAYGCNACNRLMIAEAVITDTNSRTIGLDRLEQVDSDQITWHPRPKSRPEFPGVPRHISQAAVEAYICHGEGAHRAAVALSRAVIEATAKDKNARGKNLADSIDAMKALGLLRPATTEAAHEVRHWGNDMAHGDFVNPIAAVNSMAVLDLMSGILQEVYLDVITANLAQLQAVRQRASQQATPSLYLHSGEVVG
jgi:hypothetical protein